MTPLHPGTRAPLVHGLLAVTLALILAASPASPAAAAPVVASSPGAVVAASGRSVDVGTVWDGYTSSGRRNTSLSDAELHEPSGIALSRVNKRVAYVHSEASRHGMVAISTTSARVVARYQVAIPHQWDWEDIATGPCGKHSCLFAGDIGRSNGRPNPPSTFAVYRVREPKITGVSASRTLTGDWFRFRYPDGPHNAEALMVHPGSGRVFVITKERSGRSGVYALPRKLPKPSATTITTLTKLATLRLPVLSGASTDAAASTWYAQVTAASIHPGGRRFLVRTPYRVYEYRAGRGRSFTTAFHSTPKVLRAPTGESQGEAIDYAEGGSAYYTIGERPAPPFVLKRVTR